MFTREFPATRRWESLAVREGFACASSSFASSQSLPERREEPVVLVPASRTALVAKAQLKDMVLGRRPPPRPGHRGRRAQRRRCMKKDHRIRRMERENLLWASLDMRMRCHATSCLLSERLCFASNPYSRGNQQRGWVIWVMLTAMCLNTS